VRRRAGRRRAQTRLPRAALVTSDAAAASVPTRVQLWAAPSGGVLASTTCRYDADSNQFRCVLKIPATLTPGNYSLAAETQLGRSGPWTLAAPVSGASNPQLQTIV